MEYYNKFKGESKKEESSLGEELMPLKDRKSYEYDDYSEEVEEKLGIFFFSIFFFFFLFCFVLFVFCF